MAGNGARGRVRARGAGRQGEEERARRDRKLDLLAQAETEAVKKFCSELPYPSFGEAQTILMRADVELYVEYGEMNHELLKDIYETGFTDEALICSTRNAILSRGGMQALHLNYYALYVIMVSLVRQAPQHLKGMVEVFDESGAKIYTFDAGFVIGAAHVSYLRGPWFSE